MKKLFQSAQLNLKNVERSLLQNLSEQQSSALSGGQRLVQEFQSELTSLGSPRQKESGLAGRLGIGG